MKQRHLGFIGLVAVSLLLGLAGCTSPQAYETPIPGSSASTSSVAVTGRVHAGPVCPVVRPDDSACADRPVAGAVLAVTTAAGAEVARATSAADGTFTVELAAGDYVLVPQPVDGLMGTAPRQPFHVLDAGGQPVSLDVAYDTGIR